MESSFAGVDWASEKRDVVVQNAAGDELLAASFAHDEATQTRPSTARPGSLRPRWASAAA
jgi:hypothetical protein